MYTLAISGAFLVGLQGSPITTGEAARLLGEALADRSPATAVRDCADTGAALRGTTAPVTCGCPAIAPEMLGTSVWGNMVYTDDSNICLAAIHDGRITTAGGRVTVWPAPGQARYYSATRSGITSWDYQNFEGSFRFTPPGVRRAEPAKGYAPAASDGPREAAPAYPDASLVPGSRASGSPCPDTGRSLRGRSTSLTCFCPAMEREMLGTSVWGNMVYTDDSNICLAAIHDGRLSLSGGSITVWPAPGRAVYRSARRNGITSIAYRDFEGSFRFTPPPHRERR